jgi:hypothetical protein
VALEVFDVDKSTKLNILEYETLSELIGKNLQITIELKRASDIPDKYSYQVMAKYVWNEETFETDIIAR